MDAIFALVPLIFGFVIILMVIMISKNVIEWHRNNQQPVLSQEARVVTKRTMVRGDGSHSGGARTFYYCTFELRNDRRLECRVSGNEYGLLAEGDEGTLTFQGTRYHGFQRR
jgi:hypothetical protein